MSRPDAKSKTEFESSRISGKGLRVALVVSRFNDSITRNLARGARAALLRNGVRARDILEVDVPGAWELPLAIRTLAERGHIDAFVALGCVIRGETDHYKYVAGEASRGLSDVSLALGVPVGFGLLTTDTARQAAERAGGKHGNKGEDAAMAALEMVNLARRFARPKRR